MIDYKIIQDNLINNTTLDKFMVNAESKHYHRPSGSDNDKVLSTDNEDVYLVGLSGQFRTSRR
jgi:hypothetical protein|tara:strand:+ start:318 stop:506 length:189 start_codon:yes stop_codon:yes gene_type:complete